MVKINISFSKKIPGKEQYSSISFHANIERELSDGLTGGQIQNEFANNYTLLENIVEQEIAKHRNGILTPTPAQPQENSNYQQPQQNNTGYQQPQQPAQSNVEFISQAQLKFLNNLASKLGKTQQQILTEVNQKFKVSNVESLTKKSASKYIDELKAAA